MAASPYRLDRGIVHTFPAANDADQAPYVFDVNVNSAGKLAVSACGPGHTIKIYDHATLQCTNQLGGHSMRVNELQWSPVDVNALYSASSDGTVNIWDLRGPGTPIHTFKSGGKEFWCADMSVDGTMLAAGFAHRLRVFDMRTRKVFRNYTDVHTDDLTQVHYHPTLPAILVTGSEDGLMCVLNNENPDIDDALQAVLSVGSPIQKVGFCGGAAQQVYALTNIQGLQLWDFGGEQPLVRVEDMRPSLQAAAPFEVSYLIDCHYNARADELFLFAGGSEGSVGVWLMSNAGPVPMCQLRDPNGHSEVVRGVAWDVAQGMLWTGGEDCKVCLWRAGGGGGEEAARRAEGGGAGKVREKRAGQGFAPY